MGPMVGVTWAVIGRFAPATGGVGFSVTLRIVGPRFARPEELLLFGVGLGINPVTAESDELPVVCWTVNRGEISISPLLYSLFIP